MFIFNQVVGQLNAGSTRLEKFGAVAVNSNEQIETAIKMGFLTVLSSADQAKQPLVRPEAVGVLDITMPAGLAYLAVLNIDESILVGFGRASSDPESFVNLLLKFNGMSFDPTFATSTDALDNPSMFGINSTTVCTLE